MRDRPAPRRRPARPVADAPVDALRARARALAKGWLLELVDSGPLSRAGAIPAAELAREGPQLCEALARALASDAELARLCPDGDLAPLAARVGMLAGARDPAGVAAAVDALRAVMWAATLEEITRPAPSQLAELADRLADLASILLAAALAPGALAGAAPARPAAEPAAMRPAADPPGRRSVAGQSTPERPHEADPPPAPPTPVDLPGRGADIRAFERRGREAPRPVERREPPPLAPTVALDQALARYARDEAPFALLIAEVDDVERVLATANDAGTLLDRVEHLVAAELRRVDRLVRESAGRFWVLAPALRREEAEGLAARVAAAGRGAGAPHGVPLRLSVGCALCPEDGTSAERLADVAEEGVFAVRAVGTQFERADG